MKSGTKMRMAITCGSVALAAMAAMAGRAKKALTSPRRTPNRRGARHNYSSNNKYMPHSGTQEEARRRERGHGQYLEYLKLEARNVTSGKWDPSVMGQG